MAARSSRAESSSARCLDFDCWNVGAGDGCAFVAPRQPGDSTRDHRATVSEFVGSTTTSLPFAGRNRGAFSSIERYCANKAPSSREGGAPKRKGRCCAVSYESQEQSFNFGEMR